MQNANYAELFGTVMGAALGAAVVLYGLSALVVEIFISVIS